MSYPQPDPASYVIGGYDFFRLNTLLTSDGDVYESNVSALAFALGPDSDISKVNIAYFDEETSTFMNQVSISPDRPFCGRLDAKNEGKYAPSSRPGRILIWPDEIYNETYRPAGWVVGNDRMDVVVPVLDVVQYFNNQPSIFPQRNDKTYRYQNIPWPGSNYWLTIPYYGRKFAAVEFANFAGTAITVTIRGVSFPYFGTAYFQEFELLAPTVVADSATLKKIIKSSVDGMYDYLVIKLDPTGAPTGDPTPLRIVVSDSEV